MASIECITLDDSDDGAPAGGGGAGVRGVQRLPQVQPHMVRCSLCVDPGLLPVETDRAKHR